MAVSKRRACIFALMYSSNFLTSTALIFLNKWLYQHYNFSKTLLICYHFFCTSLAMGFCCLVRLVRFKRLPLLRILPVTISFTVFILLTNYSLDLNTVGTSQVLKCLSDPMLVLTQAVFYSIHQPKSVKISLIPMIAGVIINSSYDIKFTRYGFFIGLISAMVGTHYTIQVNRLQSFLHVTASQLLTYQAPLSCLLLFIYVVLSSPQEFLKIHFTSSNYIIAMATGLAAFMFNLSTYWILGNASVMTFTVFSKTKLCATVIGGFIIFKEPFHITQLIGISLTMVGVGFYSFAKYVETRREKFLLPKIEESNGQYSLPTPLDRYRKKSESSDLPRLLGSFKNGRYDTV